MTPGGLNLSILGPQKLRQNGLSDNVLFGIAPVSQYVVNEGADNKLNSMDSILVDIENVVIRPYVMTDERFSPSLWLI